MRTVGGVIDANQAAIVQMWMEGSREALFAEGLTQLQLKNMMPEYLSLLGRGRPGDSAGLSGAQQALIERHLSNRLRQGAVLNEILTEFAVLGRCVSRFLGSEDGADRPSVADIGRLFAELSLTCAAVTRIFSEHLLEDEQTEKRYSRLLRDIGGQSIERGHAMSLKRQVKEALALIAQAMGAQTAALLLHDAKTDRLIMSASRGVADEELEAYVRELEISAEESAQPPVSEALGRGGIQSVLSARLVPCHLLRGVLHVGFREERTFTANEVRRLHSLGDVLAVHLDNVHLNASLTERSEQIAAECDLRERFVSILMHDLMGPLAAARAGARKLLEDSIDGTQASATTIARSLARMEHMVHGLLDAHRIRAGHQLPMAIESCDLGALARSTVEELRGVYGDRFIVRGDAHVRGMWSPDQLQRAIWNLVVNGAKHGAKGAPVVISVKREGDEAELTVHNQGPAIPSADQAELFRPFSLPRSGGGHPRGWGLGLTLVWGCADCHGGRVSAESHAGQGTTFKLVIPMDARPYADPQ